MSYNGEGTIGTVMSYKSIVFYDQYCTSPLIIVITTDYALQLEKHVVNWFSFGSSYMFSYFNCVIIILFEQPYIVDTKQSNL